MVTQSVEKTTGSLNRFFDIVFNSLPESALSIEDIIIKGNRVILKYRTQRHCKPETARLRKNNQAVAINTLSALRLSDGKVVEHRDNIYQIKTLPQA